MVLLFCTGCDEHASLGVWIASGPTHVARGDTATYVVTSGYSGFFPSGTLRYRVEWGDSMTITSDVHSIGDTVRFTHAWRKSGTYAVTALAYGKPDTRSYPRYVVVSDSNDPVIDTAQFYSDWRPVELAVAAHAPAGESLRLTVSWGDGRNETTGFLPSPCRLSAIHRYADAARVQVVVRALDESGRTSFPDTLSGWVSTYGEVTSYYLDSYSGSPVIADDVIYLAGPDGFCGLRPGGTQYTYPGTFAGHPSFSSQTEHVYMGSDDGRLCAFSPTLQLVWDYSSGGSEWGPTAVRGNALYVPCTNDSIYCLIDNGTSVVLGAVFAARLVDAVVVDATGSVYFGTGEGYLYKLTAGLNPIWSVSLQAGGRVFSPAIGADGTVLCSSDSNRLYAVNPDDGVVKWTVPLAGVCKRPTVGSDGVYAGTSAGRLYKLDPGTGAALWEKQLGSDELAVAPVLTASGYVYAQTSGDRLYCVSQSNGDSVWVCNCAAYLPRQPRGGATWLTVGANSPTVDAEGKVWIVGSEALYKLASYGQLDASSPWPKWQHDLYNTGFVGGGK